MEKNASLETSAYRSIKTRFAIGTWFLHFIYHVWRFLIIFKDEISLFFIICCNFYNDGEICEMFMNKQCLLLHCQLWKTGQFCWPNVDCKRLQFDELLKENTVLYSWLSVSCRPLIPKWCSKLRFLCHLCFVMQGDLLLKLQCCEDQRVSQVLVQGHASDWPV